MNNVSLPAFGNAYMNVREVESADPVTEDAIGTFDHVLRVVSTDASYGTVLSIPNLSTCVEGRAFRTVIWDGVGTLKFEVAAGSGETVNGASSITYEDQSAIRSVIFLYPLLENWALVQVPYSLTATGGAVAPNVQIIATGYDAGHELGVNSIYFAERGATAYPVLNSATDKTVVLGYRAGTNAGASKTLQDGNVLIGSGAGGGATVLAAGEICIGPACAASGVADRLSFKCQGIFPHTFQIVGLHSSRCVGG